jgi:hypothetical protein
VPADVPAALADLAAAFAALGVRWYVFGAQAVIAAGVPRLTADIDVTVELPRGGPRALIAALARAGIALRPVGDVATFIAETRVIPAIHVASQLPIDVVLAGPGLEEDMLARARRRPVGGTDVPFVDTPDLIALKILAGRDKDLEDVRALGRAGLPGRSLAVARHRVAELGTLIDDSTLIATFDRLIPPTPVGRTRTTKRPRPAARKKR